jgi:predicted PurR-regulated permease PerM
MAKEEKIRDNDSGVVSLIFGILSIVSVLFTTFAIFAPLACLIFAILGLIFGIVQNKKSKNKWATAGIVLSAIGLISNIIIAIFVFKVLTNFAIQVQQQIQQAQQLQQFQQEAFSQYAQT